MVSGTQPPSNQWQAADTVLEGDAFLSDILHHSREFDIKRRLLADRTRAMAALRESEERFRSSFEHAAIGMALVSLDGRWLQVNRAVCGIVGYSEAELLVTDFQTITYPDDLAADLTHVQRLLTGEARDYQMTKRYFHKSGRIVWVMLSVSLIRDETGRPLYFISQIQDVTERKLIEDALRTSEEGYRTTFEMAGVGMAHMDLHTGRFIRVNRKLCAILGYAADELRCMTFQQLTHPDDLENGCQAALDMTQGKTNEYASEKRYFRKDGSIVWVSLNATMIRDINGRTLHSVAMFKEITDSKRAEEALRASERQFRTLASHAPVGIFQRDSNGRNVFVNERWSFMTGMSAQEAAGDGWKKAVHPDDRERVTSQWQRVETLGDEFASEYRYLSKQGKITWVHGTAVPMRDETGTLIGYLGTSTDVTERKRAEWLEHDRREVLELVAQDRPLGVVLDHLVHLVERQTDRGAAVMLLDNGVISLHTQNLPDNLVSAIKRTPVRLAASLIEEIGEGSSGCHVTDLSAAPSWEPLRAELTANALSICWAVPIRSNEGMVLGVISVFCPASRLPANADMQMLEMVSKLATISIEHHLTTRQLAHLVRHDPLTGLPNRILFDDRLQQALAAIRRNGKSLALFVLDVDRFKSINDTLGHQAGDEILQQFAYRIRALVRATDTLARVGGDEFLLLLPELPSADSAATVAATIISALAEPFTAAGQELRVTSSIGIAISPRDGTTSANLQASADAAMYQAKRQGRNQFAISSNP